ncbi:MAG: alpha/beta hydrolase [Gammaproteobacteria bacterium]|nr:alpha/beta hydrolase [Gammaproteobacteria bacterium]
MRRRGRIGLARGLALCGLLVLLATVVGAFALDRGWFDLPLDELARRYQLPDSRFADVDGVKVHYVDRGEGPVIVLLHASFLSLRSWDAFAAALEDGHRVVRMDLSGAGLTGPDPTLRYGIDRNIELVRGLLAQLGIRGPVTLVGTSSGGMAAFRLAARYPDEVSRLVLINAAGMPRTAATNPLRAPPSRLAGWIAERYRSRRFWAESLTDNFTPPHEPGAALIDMTYDMNRRAGGREINRLYLANFSTGDPEAMLAGVRAPTLVLWGLDNRTLMHLEADVFARWLTGAPVLVRKYPGLGHYPYLEDPATVATDVRAFVAGELDTGLIRPCRGLGPEGEPQ